MNRVFEEIDLIKSILFDENSSILLHYLMDNRVLQVDEKLDDKQFAGGIIRAYRGLQNNHINNSIKGIFGHNVMSLFKNG
jgi:hypothetical protein